MRDEGAIVALAILEVAIIEEINEVGVKVDAKVDETMLEEAIPDDTEPDGATPVILKIVESKTA